jgi:lipid-binding SYLF domain-containing protein
MNRKSIKRIMAIATTATTVFWTGSLSTAALAENQGLIIAQDSTLDNPYQNLPPLEPAQPSPNSSGFNDSGFNDSEIESTAPGVSGQDRSADPFDSTSDSNADPFGDNEFGDNGGFDNSEDGFEVNNGADPNAGVNDDFNDDFENEDTADPSGTKAVKKLAEALETFEEFMSHSRTRISPRLLSQSEGIVIIPDIVQAGFIFGGRKGTGIMLVRNSDGSWSNPAFVKISGGSVGLQAGAKSSDLILVFPKRSMLYEATTGSFKLGGSVSGNVGPIGDDPVDSTREYSRNRIYSYSRSNGLFGGLSLEGSELSFNQKRNQEFYGASAASPRQIFNSYQSTPPVVASLKQALSQAETGNFRLF